MLTTPRRIARDNALSGTLPTVNMPTLSVLCVRTPPASCVAHAAHAAHGARRDVRNNVFSGPLLLPPAVVSATAQNNSFASIAWVSPATTQRVCVFLQAQENPIGGTLDFTLLAPGALVNLSATRFAMTLPNVAAPPSGL